MTLSIVQFLDLVIGWAKRRFWLIAIPLVLTVPFSIAAALLLPQKYVATTLLLMQEVGTDNPFARDLRHSETPADKIGALQALMFSDRNLTDVLVELNGPHVLLDAKALHRARDELRRALSIAPSGPEFVAIRYTSSNPKGMGRTLNIVLSRLLETLLKDDIEASVAPQVVKARMLERQAELEAAISAMKTSQLIHEILASNANDRAGLSNTLESLKALQVKLAAQSAAPTRQSADAGSGLLPSIGGNSALAGAPEPGQTANVGELDRLRQEIAFLHLVLDRTDATPSVLFGSSLQGLENQHESARKTLADWTQRYGSQPSTGLSFMRAPERIVVIDPPRDPELAQHARSRIAFIGLASGLALALGLGLLGELLDRRVRTAEQLRAVTGVEVLVRLPKA